MLQCDPVDGLRRISQGSQGPGGIGGLRLGRGEYFLAKLRDVEPWQVQVEGVHSWSENPFSKELPKHLLHQKDKLVAAVAPIHLILSGIFDVRSEAIPRLINLMPGSVAAKTFKHDLSNSSQIWIVVVEWNLPGCTHDTTPLNLILLLTAEADRFGRIIMDDHMYWVDRPRVWAAG